MMLKLETIDDLHNLHVNKVPESLTLEYKASPAVENTPARKAEIAKDVMAMANAAGGQFVYGMTEHNHLPAGLDEGIDPTPYNGLWFEQVIQQNVRPQIEGLKILPIQLGNGKIAVVITVPASLVRSPHQLANDGRYYRRRNFRNDVMEDYEVREAMHRSTTPCLSLAVAVDGPQSPFPVIFEDGAVLSNDIPLSVVISNSSNEPALYTVVTILIEENVHLCSAGQFDIAETLTLTNDKTVRRYQLIMSAPSRLPIFKEIAIKLSIPSFIIKLHSHMKDAPFTVQLGYQIYCPGYSTQQFFELVYENASVRISHD